ncbi:MAG: hypothetical protein MHM6MM_005826 [Cercozoa sp. M6MM]
MQFLFGTLLVLASCIAVSASTQYNVTLLKLLPKNDPLYTPLCEAAMSIAAALKTPADVNVNLLDAGSAGSTAEAMSLVFDAVINSTQGTIENLAGVFGPIRHHEASVTVPALAARDLLSMTLIANEDFAMMTDSNHEIVSDKDLSRLALLAASTAVVTDALETLLNYMGATHIAAIDSDNGNGMVQLLLQRYSLEQDSTYENLVGLDKSNLHIVHYAHLSYTSLAFEDLNKVTDDRTRRRQVRDMIRALKQSQVRVLVLDVDHAQDNMIYEELYEAGLLDEGSNFVVIGGQLLAVSAMIELHFFSERDQRNVTFAGRPKTLILEAQDESDPTLDATFHQNHELAKRWPYFSPSLRQSVEGCGDAVVLLANAFKDSNGSTSGKILLETARNRSRVNPVVGLGNKPLKFHEYTQQLLHNFAISAVNDTRTREIHEIFASIGMEPKFYSVMLPIAQIPQEALANGPAASSAVNTLGDDGLAKMKSLLPQKMYPNMVREKEEVLLGLRIMAWFFGAIGLVATVGCFVYINTHRHLRYIKMGAPNMQSVQIVGIMLGLTAMFLVHGYVELGNKSMCIAARWLRPLGFVIGFSAIMAKLWRVRRIFNRMLEAVKVTDLQLFLIVLACTVSMVIFLAVFESIDPVSSTTETLGYTYDASRDVIVQQVVTRCTSEHETAHRIVTSSVLAVLLLVSFIFAYEVREIEIPALNDSREVASATFMSCVIAIVSLTVVFVVDKNDVNARFGIEAMSLFAMHFSVLAMLYFRRCVLVMTGRHTSELHASNHTGFSSRAARSTNVSSRSDTHHRPSNKAGNSVSHGANTSRIVMLQHSAASTANSSVSDTGAGTQDGANTDIHVEMQMAESDI